MRCVLFAVAQYRVMQTRHLSTFEEVVEALGGRRNVARLTGKNTGAVCTWQRRQRRFPTKYYFVMAEALAAQRATASRDLWGFYSGEQS